MEKNKKLKIILAFTAVYLIWGSTYLAVRFAIETLPPFIMAGVRFMSAGVLMYLFAIYKGAIPPTKKEWRSAIIIGGSLLFVGHGGVVWAEKTIPSSIAALLVGFVPLWMQLLEFFVFSKRIPFLKWLGVFLGIFGLVLLSIPNEGFPNPQKYFYSVMVVLVSTLFWASGSLYSRTAPLPSSSFLSTAMQMISAGVLLFLFGSVVGDLGNINLALFSFKSIASLLYLTVFGSLIAFTAFVWLMKNCPSEQVATYAYVNPVIALFLGWWLANEELKFRTIVGAIFILIAVFFMIWTPAKNKGA